MKYEVFEYEYGCSYALIEATKRTVEGRERVTSEGGKLVLAFRATSWKRAKARYSKFVERRREEWLERNPD